MRTCERRIHSVVDASSRNNSISVQSLVSNNKMEIQSVIVSKPYPVSTNSTTSTYRGIGHSIARLAESENNDNQLATNHAQFYGNSRMLLIIITNNFHAIDMCDAFVIAILFYYLLQSVI
jgi:hypothetical protein